MAGQSTSAEERIVLRKYRNRRYYDTTRSLHVTLEDIFNLVRAGREIQVTDSQSGEDITPRVLAQIILEHDPLKLAVFPVDFLHRVIRANEPLIREFMERYFGHFLQAYLDSQRQLNEYLRGAMGLGLPSSADNDWLRTMRRTFGSLPFADGLGPDRGPRSDSTAVAQVAELWKLVQELREEIRVRDERKAKG